MKKNQDRLHAFEAWQSIRDEYVAEAELSTARPVASRDKQGHGPVWYAMDRFFHSGAWVATISSVVALSAVVAIAWAGRGGDVNTTPAVTPGHHPVASQPIVPTESGEDMRELANTVETADVAETEGSAETEKAEENVVSVLPVAMTLYDYQENNVAILNVKNSTAEHRNVTLVGHYLDEDGNELGTETKTYEGKYEITEKDDGKMEITFTFENDEAKTYGGTQSFSIDKENDTIKIGLVTYKRVE